MTYFEIYICFAISLITTITNIHSIRKTYSPYLQNIAWFDPLFSYNCRFLIVFPVPTMHSVHSSQGMRITLCHLPDKNNLLALRIESQLLMWPTSLYSWVGSCPPLQHHGTLILANPHHSVPTTLTLFLLLKHTEFFLTLELLFLLFHPLITLLVLGEGEGQYFSFIMPHFRKSLLG